MKRLVPYAILFGITCLFFWEFVLLGKIPIDVSPLYRMRPWSESPGASQLTHEFDLARYYHNVDPIIEVLPIKRWLAQHLRSGDVPLWTSALFSGAPFAANHHAAPWDPSSLLFLTFPPEIAFAITLLLHLFIAGACMYFYSRILECSAVASMIGACAFMFNSFFLHWLGLISFNAGLVWMPLVPAGIELAIRRNSFRYLSLTAVALGLSFLSGMAQFWLFNLILFLGYGLYRVLTSAELRQNRFRWTASLLLAFVLGVGIGAVQIYQTVFAFQHTSRGSANLASPYAGRNHLSPRKMITLLIPDFYGHHQENAFSKLLLNPADDDAKGLAGRLIWGEKGSVFHRSWGYIGMVPILLMIVGCMKVSQPFSFYRWLAFAVLGFQVLLCFEPLHRLCLTLMHTFDTLDHTRTIALFSFAGAILAARGVDTVVVGRKETLRKARVLLLVAAALCVAIIFILWIQPIDVDRLVSTVRNPHQERYASEFFIDAVPKISRGIQQSAQIFYVPVLILVTLLVTLSLFLKDKLSSSGFKVALLVISVCDLYHRGWNDPELVYANRSDVFPPKSVVQQFLEKDASQFRIYELHKKRPLPPLPLRKYSDLERVRKGSIRFFDPLSVEFVFRPNTLMPTGIQTAGGYMSLYPGRYKDLWDGRGMDILKAFKPGQSAESWNMPWVGMQGIKYVLIPEEVDTGDWKPVFKSQRILVMPVQSYLPLISAVSQSRVFSTPEQVLAEVHRADFDPHSEVLLEQNSPTVAGSGSGEHKIENVTRSPDTIHFKAKLGSDAYVVISENLFPGWHATVNGQDLKLLPANYAFSCLPLKKGTHDILLTFQPELYRFSLWVSIVAVAVTLLSALGRKSR